MSRKVIHKIPVVDVSDVISACRKMALYADASAGYQTRVYVEGANGANLQLYLEQETLSDGSTVFAIRFDVAS